MKFLLVSLVCSVFVENGLAWLPSPSVRQGSPHRPLTIHKLLASTPGVETIQLEGLGDDHDKVGQEMAVSVQRWLDAEWSTDLRCCNIV